MPDACVFQQAHTPGDVTSHNPDLPGFPYLRIWGVPSLAQRNHRHGSVARQAHSHLLALCRYPNA
ncbi:MAG: hypothetical protein OJF50_004920 [Nitrospira sp.]|nr:hypothetical protein [Nitrospira sp.]